VKKNIPKMELVVHPKVLVQKDNVAVLMVTVVHRINTVIMVVTVNSVYAKI